MTAPTATTDAPPPSFFTVSDSRFFPGTVVLLNSLRLTGNDGELVVLDAGLTDVQRSRLEPVTPVVERPPTEASRGPYLAKLTADLFRTGVVVLIDSDMIVTRKLDDLIAAARAGKIVVFPDHEVTRDRRFEEWQERFRLDAPLRAQRYANAGFVALSLDHWPGFLARWREACAALPPRSGPRDPSNPFALDDQDALNALLMSEVAERDLAIGETTQSLHPDALREVELADDRDLACTYRGGTPALLHFSLAPKAWEPAAWRRIRKDDAYVRLFPRLAFGGDVPLRLTRKEVAVWMRSGARARAAVFAADLANRAEGFVRYGNVGPLHRSVQTVARAVRFRH